MQKTLTITIIFALSNVAMLHAQDTLTAKQNETNAQVGAALRKADRYYKRHRRYKAFPIYLRYAASPLFTAKEAIRLGDIYEHRDINDVEDFVQATY